ncbi:MAG TPA: hypothetical protein VHK69_08430 [Chitinophagaceae bacterium]|jgi:hypothetical protein|nr:hypothetical protein [Chitinophagaceae bacterium]
MKRLLFALAFLLALAVPAQAQVDTARVDTSDVEAVRRMVQLSEVVIRTDLNVGRFLQLVKNDTTFYKAFRNLRILGFTSLNDISLTDKRGRVQASLRSKTRQVRSGGCRTMEVLEEKTTGDFYEGDRAYNYYTAELYAGLFFTRGRVCGENNIVGNTERNVRNKKGADKHKEQLKMLFFNPGKHIPGIPFIGDKLDVFDEDVAPYYDYLIDYADLNGQPCYVFSIKAKEGLTGGQKDKIVFDNITTWFHARSFEILSRTYDLSYNAAVYDFDVHMEVEMTRFNGLLVPAVLRYKGTWDVALKKRERGQFTATLSGFTQ